MDKKEIDRLNAEMKKIAKGEHLINEKDSIRVIRLKDGPYKAYIEKMTSPSVQDSIKFTSKLLDAEMKKFHE